MKMAGELFNVLRSSSTVRLALANYPSPLMAGIFLSSKAYSISMINLGIGFWGLYSTVFVLEGLIFACLSTGNREAARAVFAPY